MNNFAIGFITGLLGFSAYNFYIAYIRAKRMYLLWLQSRRNLEEILRKEIELNS